MRLQVKALGFAMAILAGGYFFLGTWWIILLDGASNEAVFLSKIYRGYTITPLGSVIGLLWGLLDGFICGAILAWLYNRFVGKAA
jgi:hypothetical protein